MIIIFTTSPRLLSNAKLCKLIDASMIPPPLLDSSVYIIHYNAEKKITIKQTNHNSHLVVFDIAIIRL